MRIEASWQRFGRQVPIHGLWGYDETPCFYHCFVLIFWSPYQVSYCSAQKFLATTPMRCLAHYAFVTSLLWSSGWISSALIPGEMPSSRDLLPLLSFLTSFFHIFLSLFKSVTITNPPYLLQNFHLREKPPTMHNPRHRL